MNIWAKDKDDFYSSFGEGKTIKIALEIFGEVTPKSPYGSGDDCAIVDKSSLKDKVFVTTDSVIAGVHFDFDCEPIKAGKKLMKRNISDIAAMGGLPKYAQTSAILSANLSMQYLKDFLLGMKLVAKDYGIKIIGGDIASVKADFFSMHLTLIGDTNCNALLRDNAEIGDYICCTGTLGSSYESSWHLDFKPRIAEGIFLAKQAKVKSCIDITDGIASDLKHLLPKKSYAELTEENIPLRSFKNNNLTKALCDGEDYELLFCIDKNCDFESLNKAYQKEFKESLSLIGQIKEATLERQEFSLFIKNRDSKIAEFKKSGYSHD